MLTYAIHALGYRPEDGITRPLNGSLKAIVKFDTEESVFCVYSEIVAARLGQTLHLPVATGVLVPVGAGLAFASLRVAAPGVALPNLSYRQLARVAAIYADEAAGLVAFDVWIGNSDRAQNIKASLNPHVHLFSGFDHSHALLGLETSPDASIGRLVSHDPIVSHHPFQGLIRTEMLDRWLGRIEELPVAYIAACCRFSRPIGLVSEQMQEELELALVARRNNLRAILGAKYRGLSRKIPTGA